MQRDFQPKIVAFTCNWGSYAGLEYAGTIRLSYPADVRFIRVMCAGRINQALVLKAFELGADGVLLLGCTPEECHYDFGSKRFLEGYQKTELLLKMLGIEKERLRWEGISATQVSKFIEVVKEFVEKVKEIGPSPVRTDTQGK